MNISIMSFEVTTLGRSIGALTATERALPSVRSQVPFQMPRTGAQASTDGALRRALEVSRPVHFPPGPQEVETLEQEGLGSSKGRRGNGGAASRGGCPGPSLPQRLVTLHGNGLYPHLIILSLSTNREQKLHKYT